MMINLWILGVPYSQNPTGLLDPPFQPIGPSAMKQLTHGLEVKEEDLVWLPGVCKHRP
jgi:hypothetical protein